MDLMPLEEDSDRTIVSRKMLGYQYKGMSYPAKYWVTMFSGLFGQILKEKKEETIAAIAGNACPGVLSLKHEDGMTILNKKLGIWFANNSSIPAKLAALRALFKALGIRLDECGIYLKAVAGRPATAVQYPQVPKSDRSGKPTLLVEDAAWLVRNGRRDKARIAAALQDGAAPSEVPLPQDRPEAEPVPQEQPVSGGEAPAPATSSAPLSSDTPEAEPEPQEKAAAGGEAPAPAESDPSSRMITIVPDAPEAWKEIAVDVGRIFVLGDGHSGEVFLSRPKKRGTCSGQAFSRLSVLDPRVLETLGLHLHEGPGKHKGPKGVRLENRPEKATSIAEHMGWNISFEAVRLDA
ncbi:MAG: hypothetical protein IJ649_09090 [Oscillospiraceae bacterium]|nr:hypothetical protein [Oscillospiraceae bacterium]